MSTQQTMITRWPCHVRDRHAGKITIYGWSTSPRMFPLHGAGAGL
jgi:hypothetical protein